MIELTYDGKKYALEYTRRTVKQIERMGFDFTQLSSKPFTMMPLLFYGAFLKNHPKVKADKAEAILADMENKDGLIAELGNMYADTLNSLIGDDGTEKNGKWGVK